MTETVRLVETPKEKIRLVGGGREKWEGSDGVRVGPLSGFNRRCHLP